ncbi:MAG: peptidoglycan DD-metalloendopeptidase family protein [Muribaculaceae bacterium]|nr:peptidoglycan DD-metalloendopeptidase family protein [Muribaculaceae bacterium]
MQFSQITRNLKTSFILTLIAGSWAITKAEQPTYRLPGQHQQQHGDLMASRSNSNIKVDNTTHFLESLFNEEEEPEYDIYTEGWNSKHVNCYNAADVPARAKIDVSRFSMPHPGYLTSPYGYRKRFKRMHKGVDIKVQVGDTIRAAFDGRVRITNYEARGYGYYVVLRHTNDLETVYGHLSKFLVKDDQYVKAGDPIALGGNTGRSTGSHLHFETRYMGYAINPCAIFDFANQTTHTDYYTFTKETYQDARNFSAEANERYAAEYRKANPNVRTPGKSSATSSSPAKYYTIKKGDTLARIATKNHTTVKKLCALNGISSSKKLKPGTRLKVK